MEAGSDSSIAPLARATEEISRLTQAAQSADALVARLREESSSLHSKIKELEAAQIEETRLRSEAEIRRKQLEEEVSGLQSKIAELEACSHAEELGRLTAAESQNATDKARIDELEKLSAAQTGEMQRLEAECTQARSDSARLQSEIDAASAEIEAEKE